MNKNNNQRNVGPLIKFCFKFGTFLLGVIGLPRTGNKRRIYCIIIILPAESASERILKEVSHYKTKI